MANDKCQSCEVNEAKYSCGECGEPVCKSCAAFIGERVILCDVCWADSSDDADLDERQHAEIVAEARRVL